MIKNYIRKRKNRVTNFRGFTYIGDGMYENDDGDKYKKIGKRKLLKMSDEQMGWTRKWIQKKKRYRSKFF